MFRKAHSAVALVALVIVALALPASAQVPVLERTAALARLDPLTGTWHGRVERTLPNGRQLVVESLVTTDWDVGGVWLRSRDLSELPDGTMIENLTELTWNRARGTYEGAWRDNVFPEPTPFTGSWRDETTLVLDTGEFLLGDREHRVVQTYALESENVLRTTLSQAWDGAEPEVVAEGRFERLHAEIRHLDNPLKALSDRLGTWVSQSWETDASGVKKRGIAVTDWALDGEVMRTRQYAEYEDGRRVLELEENVSWDAERGRFETLIWSTAGWTAYAFYVDLGDGLRRLDCDVVFPDGRSLGVIDLFQTVEPGRVAWSSYFVQKGKKSAEPVFETIQVREESG